MTARVAEERLLVRFGDLDALADALRDALAEAGLAPGEWRALPGGGATLVATGPGDVAAEAALEPRQKDVALVVRAQGNGAARLARDVRERLARRLA